MLEYIAKTGAITTATTGDLNDTGIVKHDVTGIGTVGIDVRGTFVATLVPEGTVDGTNWFTLTVYPQAGGAGVTSITAAGTWTVVTAGFRAIRLKCSAYTSGTATVALVGLAGVGHSTSVALTVDTEFPAHATGADNTATPDTTSVYSFGMVYDGTTWDFARGTAADGTLVNLGTNNDVSLNAGSALVGDVGISGARTSGGTTIFRSIDLDESEEEIKATAGQVYWMHVINLANAVRYLKFYNATAANVTVGTTTPVLTLPIPTLATTNGNGFVFCVPNGIAFSTAITAAATTGLADNDTGAPGANEIVINLGYA